MRRALLIALLLFPVISSQACGPSGPSLKIKAGYTSEDAVRMFGNRQDWSSDIKAPGEIVVSTIPDRSFTSLQDAVNAASDGAEIQIPAGRYDGGVILKNRHLRLVGAGIRRSIVQGRETALWVSGGDVEVEDIAFVSSSTAENVSVVALTDTTARIAGCMALGGTGPGVLITGTSGIHLEGNMIAGNMGGGVLVKGGAIYSFRNVLVWNAQAGYVFSPPTPDAFHSLTLDHETVLDNWQGPRCLSVLRAGLVPASKISPKTKITASILNLSGLGELLGPKGITELRKGNRNFISEAPLPAPEFFTDPESLDFSPRQTLRFRDHRNLELGAVPSRGELKGIAGRTQAALLDGKLDAAYILSRFLPMEERRRFDTAVRKALEAQTARYLRRPGPGIFLHSVLALNRITPRTWKISVLTERFSQNFRTANAWWLDDSDLFADTSEAFRSTVKRTLTSLGERFPIFLADRGSARRGLLVAGSITEPATEERTSRAIQELKTIQNTYLTRLNDEILLTTNKVEKMTEQVQALEARLNNPHIFPPGKTSKRKVLLQAQLKKQKAQLQSMSARLAALKKRQKEAPVSFVAEVTGKVFLRILRGEARMSLAQAPEGKILLDQSVSLFHTDRWLDVHPIAAYDFPGVKQEQPSNSIDMIFAEQIGAAVAAGIILSGVNRLEGLLARWDQGVVNSDLRDDLVEAIYLHAPNFAAARKHRIRHEEILQELSKPGNPSPVDIDLGYDPSKGKGIRGVTLKVRLASTRQRLNAEKARLESLYLGYWRLEPQVEKATAALLGVSLDRIISLRSELDRLIQK